MISWGCRFPPKNEQKQVLKITSVIWMVTWNCQTILYEVTQWSKNLLFPLIQCFALIRLMELECWRLFQIHSRNCRKISVIEMNFNHSSLQILVRLNSHVTFTNQRYLQLQIPQLIFKCIITTSIDFFLCLFLFLNLSHNIFRCNSTIFCNVHLEQILDNSYRGATSAAHVPKLDKNHVKAATTAFYFSKSR